MDRILGDSLKLARLRGAAQEQLSPEEYKEFEQLLSALQAGGMTPYINRELGRLMAKVTWLLEVEESPEWEEALIACDEAFLGAELRRMCYDYGISPIGHKKELCRRLYRHKVPEVVAVMEPHL